MINQPTALTPPPMTAIPSISSIGDLGNLDKGPLKMLPDLDADNDEMPGGDMEMPGDDLDAEPDLMKSLDRDGDGDHDTRDHEIEKDSEDEEDEEEKKEAFGNSVEGDRGLSYKGMSASIHDGTDEHREKGTFPKVAGGDNPMQRVKEGSDLRAQIRAELLQRLSEAKGAK
jgi:hypothetical protein